jgi:hypothetical protein
MYRGRKAIMFGAPDTCHVESSLETSFAASINMMEHTRTTKTNAAAKQPKENHFYLHAGLHETHGIMSQSSTFDKYSPAVQVTTSYILVYQHLSPSLLFVHKERIETPITMVFPSSSSSSASFENMPSAALASTRILRDVHVSRASEFGETNFLVMV